MRNPKPWQTLLFFVWTCGIFAALFLPPPKARVLEVPGLDKVIHLVLYGVFGGLAVPVMGWLSIPGGIILGVTTEWGQKFVPHRTADPIDLVTDLIGLGIGVVIIYIFERRRRR